VEAPPPLLLEAPLPLLLGSWTAGASAGSPLTRACFPSSDADGWSLLRRGWRRANLRWGSPPWSLRWGDPSLERSSGAAGGSCRQRRGSYSRRGRPAGGARLCSSRPRLLLEVRPPLLLELSRTAGGGAGSPSTSSARAQLRRRTGTELRRWTWPSGSWSWIWGLSLRRTESARGFLESCHCTRAASSNSGRRE
jgi:hypothetical protein